VLETEGWLEWEVGGSLGLDRLARVVKLKGSLAKLELFELNGSTEAVPSPVDPLKLLPNGSRESVWLKFFEPNGSELEVKGSTAAAGFDPNGSIERVFDPNGSILLFDEKDSLDLAAKKVTVGGFIDESVTMSKWVTSTGGRPEGITTVWVRERIRPEGAARL